MEIKKEKWQCHNTWPAWYEVAGLFRTEAGEKLGVKCVVCLEYIFFMENHNLFLLINRTCEITKGFKIDSTFDSNFLFQSSRLVVEENEKNIKVKM